MSLEAQALKFLETKEAVNVSELYNALWAKDPSITRSEVADFVWQLAEQNKVDLEDHQPAVGSLVEYLRHWERTLWIYVSLTVSMLTVMAVYLLPSEYPFVTIRWGLGLIFVLFVPGFVTVEALFPSERDLGSFGRFALSIGLSLVMVMLTGLLLNFTPWGITLTPIMIALTALTVGVTMIALGRQYAAAK